MKYDFLPHIVNPQDDPIFPPELEPDETGLVAVGGNLSERVLLAAYQQGIFPWVVGPPVMWFSPDPRLVLIPDRFHVSRRLARVIRQGRFSVRFDHDFPRIITGCAVVPRPGQDGTWIEREIIQAYYQLYERHLVHCVGVYRDGQLCGGLYGVSLGRIFYGESMFHVVPDASKIAFYALSQWVQRHDFLFIDCQATTEHLLSLGAQEIPRPRFLELLERGLTAATLDHRWECSEIDTLC